MELEETCEFVAEGCSILMSDDPFSLNEQSHCCIRYEHFGVTVHLVFSFMLALLNFVLAACLRDLVSLFRFSLNILTL